MLVSLSDELFSSIEAFTGVGIKLTIAELNKVVIPRIMVAFLINFTFSFLPFPPFYGKYDYLINILFDIVYY